MLLTVSFININFGLFLLLKFKGGISLFFLSPFVYHFEPYKLNIVLCLTIKYTIALRNYVASHGQVLF